MKAEPNIAPIFGHAIKIGCIKCSVCSAHIHGVITLQHKRDITTMAMPTIESVVSQKHGMPSHAAQIIFDTKTSMLNTTTAQLYGQSHKMGINYFNCI